MRWTHGRKWVVVALLAVLIAAAIAGNSLARSALHQSADPYLRTYGPPQVLGVTAWSFGRPNPHEKAVKVDVFSVEVRNRTKQNYVSFGLTGLTARYNYIDPLSLNGSEGFGWSDLGIGWTIPLNPGQKATVFFVSRTNNRIKQYCFYGATKPPGKCTTPRP